MVRRIRSTLSSQRDWLLENLSPVMGHRGAALHAPENTLASIASALALGTRWVEVDVKLSSDGVPFLMHDVDLDRTTNGTGPASALTMKEIAQLDAGSWFGEAFSHLAPPTLEELIRFLDQHDMQANIEIKPSPGQERETARVVIDTLRLAWPSGKPWPLLSSFKTASLAAAAEHAPEMPRAFIVETPAAGWKEAMDDLACVSLHLDHEHTPPERVTEVSALGIPVLCYTVNDGRRAKAFLDAGAVSIITDAPDRVLEAMAQ